MGLLGDCFNPGMKFKAPMQTSMIPALPDKDWDSWLLLRGSDCPFCFTKAFLYCRIWASKRMLYLIYNSTICLSILLASSLVVSAPPNSICSSYSSWPTSSSSREFTLPAVGGFNRPLLEPILARTSFSSGLAPGFDLWMQEWRKCTVSSNVSRSLRLIGLQFGNLVRHLGQANNYKWTVYSGS